MLVITNFKIANFGRPATSSNKSGFFYASKTKEMAGGQPGILGFPVGPVRLWYEAYHMLENLLLTLIYYDMYVTQVPCCTWYNDLHNS